MWKIGSIDHQGSNEKPHVNVSDSSWLSSAATIKETLSALDAGAVPG